MISLDTLAPLIQQLLLFTHAQQKTNQLLTDQNQLLTQILTKLKEIK